MASRLTQLQQHLTGQGNHGSHGSQKESVTGKTPDDVVIVAAYRSAIGKGFKGGFKDVNSDYLLAQFLKEFFSKVDIDKSLVEEVACGNVLNFGAGATEHRAAMLAAGLPYGTPLVAINRQCSSGLTAVNDISNKILAGQISVGLAVGVESMSKNYGKTALGTISEELKSDKSAASCLIPMGLTNENVAKKFGISREEQDRFALESFRKAEKAVSNGLFKDEILPIELPNGTKIDRDEGPRTGVTLESLQKIRPAFVKETGVTTAGNASQISDGVAGVLLMRRSMAMKLGLDIIGKYVAFQAVGVPPEIMGVGPAYAIPKVLKQCGLGINDVDVYEINEAFAGQALYCVKTLGIDNEKLNPKGGAIALGHPLGATGARQVATILRELKPGQIGVVSMCIGTGMGAAAVLVKE